MIIKKHINNSNIMDSLAKTSHFSFNFQWSFMPHRWKLLFKGFFEKSCFSLFYYDHHVDDCCVISCLSLVLVHYYSLDDFFFNFILITFFYHFAIAEHLQWDGLHDFSWTLCWPITKSDDISSKFF